MEKKKVEEGFSIGFFLLILGFFLIIHFYSQGYNLSALKEYVNSFGDYKPLVLLGMIIITSSIGLVFMVPVAVAALVMNFYEALLISIIGLTIGAIISFMIVRYLARDYVEKKWINNIKKLKDFDEHLKKRGFITILFLRLISFIPYELTNIVAGLSRMSFWSYLLGTILGIIPGILLTLYFVKTTKNLGSWQFILAMTLFTIFSLLPLLSRRMRKIIF